MEKITPRTGTSVHFTQGTAQGRGWIVSLIMHLVVIALLFIPMLASRLPLEEEEGLLVALGLPDEGQGDESLPMETEKPEPMARQEQTPEVKEVVSAKAPEKKAVSNVITNNEQDNIRVKQAEAQKQAQAEAQRKADEAARQQEAYNKTKKSYGDLLGGNGKGNTGKPGSQGDPGGDPNAKVLEGISTGSGRVGGGLGNRGVLHEPQINDKSQKTGRVVISVCVDKNGKVIKAEYTQKGSTTTDSELRDIARKAAQQFKFTTSEIEEQCGTITVDFKIKGQ